MLLPDAPLAAISIEGVAPGEDEEVRAGLEAIDVAEYFGSTDLASATRVTYLQLKHSTRQADKPWQIGGLKSTIRKFAERYVEVVARFGPEDVSERFSFVFETNRPIDVSVADDISAIKASSPGADGTGVAKATGLNGEPLRSFTNLLVLDAQTPNYLEQRRLLEADLSAYLPDSDKDAPLQLRDLVTRKATSEFATNPLITRHDVLWAIGASEQDLYPTPSLIEAPNKLVDRVQLPDLVTAIVTHSGPVIIQADAGVGKSVLATRVGDLMPEGSVTVVYDCFGNGAYRSLSGHRHRPRDGLVQLANELAGQALCDPLIPTTKADPKAYARAFGARLRQASTALQQCDPNALLCLVIDAADNAETAAHEAHDGASFARLLLREPLPSNVRLVLTARTHRVHRLDPPPSTRRIELLPFSLRETAMNLCATFPDATTRDIEEFHRLTSSNPRVQAAALAGAASLSSMLAGLGPEPLTVQGTIAQLLEAAVAKVRDETPAVERPQLDHVCEALATLRPFVPLEVVARTADVPMGLVTSLANDLGRPLLVRDNAVQFRDEPTETWFRERFRPSAGRLGAFIGQLLPLASSSSYVAATLPQLMLEARQFDTLVKLSLEGGALPLNDAVARRDVELQRLRFSLQAALQIKHYEAAAKLSLKMGGEVAAGDRQQQLISANTDLGVHFLDSERLAEQVARRQVSGGGWTGSEHAYESALLSGSQIHAGDARNRLRIAHGWLDHWNCSQRGEREEERVEIADIAEIAWAELNLHGPEESAWQLRRWKPRQIAFLAGRIVAARLVDAARFDEVDALALAAGNDIGLLLAIGLELSAVGRIPPDKVVRRAIALAASSHLKLEALHDWRGGETLVAGITALVAGAATRRLAPRRKLANVMRRYLPARVSRSLGGRHVNFNGTRSDLMRGFALWGALRGRPLQIGQLATAQIRKALVRKARQGHDPDVEEFRRDVGALLPWANLWAAAVLGRVRPVDVMEALAEAAGASAKAEGAVYREEAATADEIADWWGQIILTARAGDDAWAAFDAWRGNLRRPLSTGTLLSLSRRTVRGGAEARGLCFARESFDLAARQREDAEQKTETLIKLARAVLPASLPEARAYFQEAVVASGKIGSENLSRWQAMLHLGQAAACSTCDDPEMAYRLARAAELTYEYVVRDKYFDWEQTVETLAAISPSSILAILSRWQDRRFGRSERLLPVAVDRLIDCGKLEARAALALLPIQGWWKVDRLIESALAADPDHARVAAEHVVRYLRFSTDSNQLHKLVGLLRVNGLDLHEAEAALRRTQSIESARPKSREERRTSSREATHDWDSVFAGLSLTYGPDLLAANDRFRSGEAPYYQGDFYQQTVSRIRPGEEASFLDALRDSRAIDLLDLRALLEVLPASWNERLSFRPALQRLLRAVCRQDATRVSADRHFMLLPWKLASEVSALNPRELMKEAINEIADTSVPDTADGQFRLAGILSQQLGEEEARRAFRYGLDLFEPLLESTDGDGPWSSRLQPPAEVEAATAGYVWAALGSPISERRWEAAHAVRAICRLQCHTVLKFLIEYARGRPWGPFTDANLRFYDQHALLWLLVALARAAEDDGPVVAAHVEFLRCHARRDRTHVLQRSFAARTLLSLGRQNLVEISTNEAEVLRTINISRLPPLENERGPSESTNRNPASEEDRFHFDMDFRSYWLAPLGRAFGLGSKRIERETQTVIRKDWKLGDDGRWDRDERALRRFFDYDSTHHSHGTVPKVHDLRFYLSFHAMMAVAGKLLETEPARSEIDDSWQSFPEWLRGHDLSRPDGQWLADRRDPTPPDALSFPVVAEADWLASATADEALRLLMLPDDNIAVAGHWTAYAGDRQQVVSVSSALVSQDRSEALARALRTASDPMDFKVPEYQDRLEIDEPPYVFKGWVRDGTEVRGLDEYDPWAASINPRILAPADPFVGSLGLQVDGDERRWLDSSGLVHLRSQSWSEGVDDEQGAHNGSGRRLLATSGCLQELMRTTGLDLLIEVDLRRELNRSRYAREGERLHVQKVTEIVLFRPDREPWHVRFGSGTRSGAGRRTRARPL